MFIKKQEAYHFFLFLFFYTQNGDSKASHLHLPAAKRKRMTAIECIFLLIVQPESRVKCDLSRVVNQISQNLTGVFITNIFCFISPNTNDAFWLQKMSFLTGT